MRVRRFASTQFRNLTHDAIAFSPRVNLFVGENGQGKTNVLEAIQFFKFARSFRTVRDTDLIHFDADFARVEVDIVRDGGDDESFSVSIERNGTKRLRADGNDVTRTSELVGRYPCVLFGPHDLELTSGAPAERRRFLDMVGSMTDPGYLSVLRAYRRVVTQRNAALKTHDFESAFSVWTEELMARGCELVAARQRLTDSLAVHLGDHARMLDVPYGVALGLESELVEGRPQDVPCGAHYAARLASVEAEETRRRTTLIGPHRDDVRIVAAGRDLRRYGSQGQRRLVAVLLRLAELSYLESHLGESCVLLLDDLFSELDERVAARLKAHLDGTHQIFVTSPVDIDWPGEGRTYRVEAGCVVAAGE